MHSALKKIYFCCIQDVCHDIVQLTGDVEEHSTAQAQLCIMLDLFP